MKHEGVKRDRNAPVDLTVCQNEWNLDVIYSKPYHTWVTRDSILSIVTHGWRQADKNGPSLHHEI